MKWAGDIVRYIKAVVSVTLVAILLSGCSFRLASSVNDLISPVAPFGDNVEVKTAMDSYAKNGYSLKTPSSGDYTTSYCFFDIDGDDTKEAFAFYEPKDDLGTIDLAVIKKIDGTWKVVKNIKGQGKDIYSISFCDINGDGNDEAFVCWDVISNSTNHVLSVYKFSFKGEKCKVSEIGESISINNYSTVDISGDGIKDLLIFAITSGTSPSAKAQLYSLENDKFLLMGETKLDSHITNYKKLQIEKIDGNTRLYADAVGSDGESMTTELIYWSDTYDTIISPFYSYSTGLSEDTTRNLDICCMDVNEDGLIEIPSNHSMDLPKGIKAVNWKIYKNTILLHSAYSLYSPKDNYTIVIDDDFIDKIKVSYNKNSRKMTVTNKKTNKKVFSVLPVLKAVYSESEYRNYSIILENSGYYYLAEIGTDSEYSVTVDRLKHNIKSC